jgi:hypothetical protein
MSHFDYLWHHNLSLCINYKYFALCANKSALKLTALFKSNCTKIIFLLSSYLTDTQSDRPSQTFYNSTGQSLTGQFPSDFFLVRKDKERIRKTNWLNKLECNITLGWRGLPETTTLAFGPINKVMIVMK